MIDPVHVDVAVTWLSAAGCVAYFGFVWTQRGGNPIARVELFLFGTLAALLFVRGFWWTTSEPLLGRVVFATATLLPLAITLFVEHVLRRHHPLWLKVLGAATSVGFFALNLFGGLVVSRPALVSFLSCVVLVLGANGVLLVQARGSDLGERESAIAGALVFSALASVLLAVTDFREEIPGIPVRLGGLGALVLIYALLTVETTGRLILRLPARIASMAIFAATLAGAFALVNVGFGPPWREAMLRGMPVAVAWVLFSAIVTRMLALHAESRAGSFLRWLLHARLDTLDGFLISLRHLPVAAGYVVLRGSDLRAYRIERLFDLAEAKRGPLSISAARSWIAQGRNLDEAEQLVDLFERHEMTHALLVSSAPPLVLLLQLPQATDRYVGEARAAVIQRIARRLAQNDR
jgi:hypothetical protein